MASIPSVWRPAIGLQHAHPQSAEVLKKSVWRVGIIVLLCLLFLPLSFFVPLWSSTQRVHSILFVNWTVMTHFRKFRKNKQKVATGLLLDKLHKQDFAGPLACRASKVLGPLNRHLVADILPHMKIVSRTSRPGLLVGFLRIVCNGLCTAKRFRTDELGHTCRIGCPDEPDSLTHYNECPRLYTIFLSFWRHATILPQRIFCMT